VHEILNPFPIRTLANLRIIHPITGEDHTHIYSMSVTQMPCERLKTVLFGPVKCAESKPAGHAVAIFV
jgi:hypothetical protein